MRSLLIAAFTAVFILGISGVAMSKSTPKNPVIVFETTAGNITVELDAKNAPKTTENFMKYVNEGFFDGKIFHRVIPNFMIQGGGYDVHFHQDETHDPIANEADNGLKNKRGTIAMARTSDPNSATAQFFINTVDNEFLNFRSKDMNGWGYAVFGKVTAGMDVVDKISASPTDTALTPYGPMQDVPVQQIVITKVSVKK